MDDLRRMAAEYRRNAAAVSLRIAEMGEPADFEQRRKKAHLVEILAELRTTAAMLEHYYDAPREAVFSAQCYFAPKVKSHDS